MIEFEYKLYDSFTAEKTRFKLITRKNSILSDTSEPSDTDRQDVRFIDVVLKDYIINYEFDELDDIPYRQNETRKSWSDAFKTTRLTYNEALCVLLGVNPSASDLLEEDLYLIQNENKLLDKTLSYLFFSRYRGSRLSIRFKKKYINTKEFILWALEERFIKQIVSNTGLKKQQRTIITQEKIDSIARTVLLHAPNISKSELSIYASDELKSKHQISLKPSAIRKRYLDTHPIY
ncbi:MAG: hypothetical protein ABGY11_11205 [Candidatus Thioglobus sp.]|jgi:hypothetical protein